MLALINQMKANGDKISDQQIVEKVLQYLTLQFEYIVMAIEKPKDLFILSVDELMALYKFMTSNSRKNPKSQ